MAKTQQKRVKPPPMRTCIACRESKPKRELLRIVRTPDGHVLLDATGKKAGRGAYLCAKLSCWENALKRKRLEQTFEITVSPEDQAALNAFVATLPTDEPASTGSVETSSKSTGKGAGAKNKDTTSKHV